MEEVCSKSSRKMQDKEETTSEASWTAVTKVKEKDVLRLELEGEAEKPEVTVLWNEAEGVSVNPEGESRHERYRSDTETATTGRRGTALVVRGVWRQIRVESAQQVAGGAKQATVPVRPRFSKCMRYRKVCENLISALKLLADQQKDGDSPFQSIVTGLCEKTGKA